MLKTWMSQPLGCEPNEQVQTLDSYSTWETVSLSQLGSTMEQTGGTGEDELTPGHESRSDLPSASGCTG